MPTGTCVPKQLAIYCFQPGTWQYLGQWTYLSEACSQAIHDAPVGIEAFHPFFPTRRPPFGAYNFRPGARQCVCLLCLCVCVFGALFPTRRWLFGAFIFRPGACCVCMCICVCMFVCMCARVTLCVCASPAFCMHTHGGMRWCNLFFYCSSDSGMCAFKDFVSLCMYVAAIISVCRPDHVCVTA